MCGKAARQPLQAGRKDVGRRGGATTLLSLRCVARQLDSHYKQAARMRGDGAGLHSPLFTVCGKAAIQPLQAGRKDAGDGAGLHSPLFTVCGKAARQPLQAGRKDAGDGAGLPLSSLYRVWQGSYTAITSWLQGCGRRHGATTLLSLPCVARQLDSHYKQAARMWGDGAGLPLSSLYGVWQGS